MELDNKNKIVIGTALASIALTNLISLKNEVALVFAFLYPIYLAFLESKISTLKYLMFASILVVIDSIVLYFPEIAFYSQAKILILFSLQINKFSLVEVIFDAFILTTKIEEPNLEKNDDTKNVTNSLTKEEKVEIIKIEVEVESDLKEVIKCEIIDEAKNSETVYEEKNSPTTFIEQPYDLSKEAEVNLPLPDSLSSSLSSLSTNNTAIDINTNTEQIKKTKKKKIELYDDSEPVDFFESALLPIVDPNEDLTIKKRPTVRSLKLRRILEEDEDRNQTSYRYLSTEEDY